LNARSGGRVEQSAAAARPDLRDRRFGRHQDGAQIEVECDLEIRHVDAFDRGGSGMADMVPHKIEPAKGVGGPPHDAAREIVLAQISDQAERAAARGGNLADDRIDARLIDVDHANRRAFTGKPVRSGPAHPGSRRRDNAYFIFEPHGSTPF
jgi:hypothetical protein